jgi:hypothetical protein
MRLHVLQLVVVFAVLPSCTALTAVEEAAALRRLDHRLKLLETSIEWKVSAASDELSGAAREEVKEASGDCDFDKLVHWFRRRGGFAHSNITLEEAEGPGGSRKVVANGTVEFSETVISIPDELVFGVTESGWARLPPLPAELAHHPLFYGSQLLDTTRLATRILVERRAGSAFEPFLRCLPRGCQGLVCASDATLQLLDAELDAGRAKRTFQLIRQGHKGNWPFGLPTPSEEEWLEAVGLVISRRWSSGMFPLVSIGWKTA